MTVNVCVYGVCFILSPLAARPLPPSGTAIRAPHTASSSVAIVSPRRKAEEHFVYDTPSPVCQNNSTDAHHDDHATPSTVSPQHWFELDDQSFVEYMGTCPQERLDATLTEMDLLLQRVQQLHHLSLPFRMQRHQQHESDDQEEEQEDAQEQEEEEEDEQQSQQSDQDDTDVTENEA
jgi:hypothetical protein